MNAFHANNMPFSSHGSLGALLAVKGHQVLAALEDNFQNKKFPDDFARRGPLWFEQQQKQTHVMMMTTTTLRLTILQVGEVILRVPPCGDQKLWNLPKEVGH